MHTKKLKAFYPESFDWYIIHIYFIYIALIVNISFAESSWIEIGTVEELQKIGKISKVIEYKVETVCSFPQIKAIIRALKKSHPYEHPAFGVLNLNSGVKTY